MSLISPEEALPVYPVRLWFPELYLHFLTLEQSTYTRSTPMNSSTSHTQQCRKNPV